MTENIIYPIRVLSIYQHLLNKSVRLFADKTQSQGLAKLIGETTLGRLKIIFHVP